MLQYGFGQYRNTHINRDQTSLIKSKGLNNIYMESASHGVSRRTTEMKCLLLLIGGCIVGLSTARETPLSHSKPNALFPRDLEHASRSIFPRARTQSSSDGSPDQRSQRAARGGPSSRVWDQSSRSARDSHSSASENWMDNHVSGRGRGRGTSGSTSGRRNQRTTQASTQGDLQSNAHRRVTNGVNQTGSPGNRDGRSPRTEAQRYSASRSRNGTPGIFRGALRDAGLIARPPPRDARSLSPDGRSQPGSGRSPTGMPINGLPFNPTVIIHEDVTGSGEVSLIQQIPGAQPRRITEVATIGSPANLSGYSDGFLSAAGLLRSGRMNVNIVGSQAAQMRTQTGPQSQGYMFGVGPHATNHVEIGPNSFGTMLFTSNTSGQPVQIMSGISGQGTISGSSH